MSHGKVRFRNRKVKLSSLLLQFSDAVMIPSRLRWEASCSSGGRQMRGNVWLTRNYIHLAASPHFVAALYRQFVAGATQSAGRSPPIPTEEEGEKETLRHTMVYNVTLLLIIAAAIFSQITQSRESHAAHLFAYRNPTGLLGRIYFSVR
ncbi:hypothetical protein EAG_14767 [Camponotus floridanus]|uniref:Uncharacterized protein n=1 Tax=Camponotus floridanus TaxID=104421 RepID=E2A581_CAMFO|nr:hypothetical protein EAG_14767 [Camponotus floridanus]